MSELGLYGSLYMGLRYYADKFDNALINLRNPKKNISEQARQEIAEILAEITNRGSHKPTTRFIAIILKQEISKNR